MELIVEAVVVGVVVVGGGWIDVGRGEQQSYVDVASGAVASCSKRADGR